MTKFLTVKEAAQITGKSPSSIRRLIYPILDNPKHADRHHIEPDVATAKALRIKGENFAWKVSEELLRREIPEGESKAGPELKSKSHGGIDQSAAIVEILRKQLDIKDQQIAAQNELIKGMSERLREGNILMGSLQQQLAPAKPANQNPTDAVVADRPPAAPEQGSGKAQSHGPIRRILHWKIF